MIAANVAPSRTWYFLPLIIALLAFSFIPFRLFQIFTDTKIVAVNFKAPGSREIEIPQPGKFVLWNEYQTIFDGKTYASGPTLPPGLTFEVTELPSNQRIAGVAGLNSYLTVNQTRRQSVATFQLPQPGRYRVSVTGQFPERIFYFRESLLRQFHQAVNAVACAAMGVVCSVLFALGIYQRRRINLRLAQHGY
jgi:hypothetical protein